jgi:hypothetical protein
MLCWVGMSVDRYTIAAVSGFSCMPPCIEHLPGSNVYIQWLFPTGLGFLKIRALKTAILVVLVQFDIS